MKHSKFPLVLPFLALAMLALPPDARALDDLIIGELMAKNDSTLADEDGDFPDWVEIYNTGANTVNLNGWYLSGNSANLTQWRFPDTNLTAGSFLVVFASNKDRRIPGRPLHTNFRLNDTGDFLALVKPDGTTVQSSYAPAYPLQAGGISYGIPVTLTTTTLLTSGAAARFTVPLNSTLGSSWTAPGFADNSWAGVANGVGFEADAPPSGAPTQIADSATEFSGTQGQSSWSYGYWSKKADANGTYEAADFTPFPRGTGTTLSSTNYWNGTIWNWPAGDPPWTELSATGGHPAAETGIAAQPIHWAIRRYVSEANGPLRITGILAASSASGTCGDGTVGRIIVDGVEVFQRAVSYLSAGYSLVVPVNLGSTIDFVIDPGAGNNDACDATTFTATVFTTAGASVVADTIADWSEAGAQGAKNWQYGYFNRTTGGTYAANKFVAFPSGTGPHSTGNYWNGESWMWFEGNPPFDTIGRIETRPSIFTTGGVNANEHWVIRRWVSEVSGALQVDWHISKKDPSGAGVVAYVFQNGTQRDTVNVTAADFVGANRTVTISGVQVGDFIDIAVAPGADIIGDVCFLNATIHGTGNLASQFASNVGTLMTNINSSAYLRIPFTVTDAASIIGLALRLKYDDGVVAYLNGTLVSSLNAPGTPDWNSTAVAPRADTDARQFEDISLDFFKDFLVEGPNVLALHGLNLSATDADFLLTAELLATRTTPNVAAKRYFSTPTPGSANGIGTSNLGPLVTQVKHTPAEPADAEDLLVTAKVSPTFNAVSNVSLYYRVMFGAETSVPMLDDGLHGDGVAGDGIYGASVPNTTYTAGQMVRYYFIARDSLNNQSRQPPIGDTNNSSLYFGTAVQDPSLTNQLPVLHWFTPTTIGGGALQRGVSMYWQGEFYDNVKMNTHGQSSGGFKNHSYNVDFNPDHNFKPDANLPRVDDINLLASYADKSHMRLPLSYQIYNDSGPRAPYHYVVPARMQSNGVFHSIMWITENGDDKYLKRLGRDPNGAMYKMYTDPSLPANAEKKTRRWEDKSDFTTFVAGINSGTNRIYLYDNIDVSQVANFFAAMIVTASVDCCHKNFYLYRDSDGDQEWEMLPWDLDLSFGRNWQSGENYWDDRVYPASPGGLFIGATFPLGPNSFFSTAADKASFRAMYLRRVRTLQDELLQTNGTPAAQLNFERQIDYWTDRMAADGALDLAKWGSWGGGNPGDGGQPGGTRIGNTSVICTRGDRGDVGPSVPCWRTLQEAAAEMKTKYMTNRRAWVFTQKMTASTTKELPDAQPANAVVTFGALEFNPSSGNQNEEYLQLVNTNTYAVDISGWKLAGAVEHTFQGGVVIPRAGSSNILYVVPDKKAFRARASAPRGGQGLYIEGPYQGQLSARGETVVLVTKAGTTNSTRTYPGNPSGPQQWLRITEMMYHPPNPPAGSPYEAEDFEYLELRNTGPTNISLLGVQFTGGLEFSFTGSAITSLAPGDYALVVRNAAAFTSRYGPSSRIAGQYVGILANEGENIQLDDAVGEKILNFEYNNRWYPVSDGPGASLVIVNPGAVWNTWGLKESWRPSARDYGSPGVTDPPTNSFVAVIVNEILAHTDPPLKDAIEILNATDEDANLSGWFVSDDFATPKKYRIPDGTILPRGSYLAVSEDQFNPTPGTPPSFSFSSRGDEAYLFSGDGTNLTGYVRGYAFGASASDVSFGRHTNAVGAVHVVAQRARTLGTNNALPQVGPIAISEIMYHPPELPGVDDNVQEEFIELANLSGGDVRLFDTNNPANTWRLRNAVDFDFPTGVILPAGSYLMVVSFNSNDVALSTSFRAKYSVPGGVPLYGPWSGKLDNSAETVELYQPDAPEGLDVPYVLVDQVDYADDTPWPVAADGLGGSLQRFVMTSYGNDPVNWVAAAPSSGGAYTGGSPPVITTQPADTTAVASFSATFDITVAGAPPFVYQWQFFNTNLPGANSKMLTLPNVQPSQAGPYRVIVFSASGSVQSSNATLTVNIPASFTSHPTNILIRVPPDPAANPTNRVANFYVVATSTTLLRYQWQREGLDLPGRTNATLTLSNVVLADGGRYRCVVTDDIGTIFSQSATLYPLVAPGIVVPPASQSVLSNVLVTISVVYTGAPPPFTNEWRRGSTAVETHVTSNLFDFFTLVASNTAQYRVVLKNLANPQPGVASAFANITALVDSDGDGIPDVVETAYGLDANKFADGAGDLDQDRMTNVQEYQAGTDPNDSSSYLRIDIDTLAGLATLHMMAVSNRTYSVQYSDLRPTISWQKLADITARPANRLESVVDPTWTSNRFYRIAFPVQP